MYNEVLRQANFKHGRHGPAAAGSTRRLRRKRDPAREPPRDCRSARRRSSRMTSASTSAVALYRINSWGAGMHNLEYASRGFSARTDRPLAEVCGRCLPTLGPFYRCLVAAGQTHLISRSSPSGASSWRLIDELDRDKRLEQLLVDHWYLKLMLDGPTEPWESLPAGTRGGRRGGSLAPLTLAPAHLGKGTEAGGAKPRMTGFNELARAKGRMEAAERRRP